MKGRDSKEREGGSRRAGRGDEGLPSQVLAYLGSRLQEVGHGGVDGCSPPEVSNRSGSISHTQELIDLTGKPGADVATVIEVDLRAGEGRGLLAVGEVVRVSLCR